MKHFCSFSEAIREGAKLGPQARFHMMREGATCALGAAALAIGFPEKEIQYGCAVDLWPMYPYMESTVLKDCPDPNCPDDLPDMLLGLGSIVVHLNDDHEWSREAIADWLESEEEKLGYVTLVEPEIETVSV